MYGKEVKMVINMDSRITLSKKEVLMALLQPVLLVMAMHVPDFMLIYLIYTF